MIRVQMRKWGWVAIFLLSLIFFSQIKTVYANEQKGAIFIDYRGVDENQKEIAPSGVEFVIYNVGDFKEENGRLNEMFQQSGVSLADSSASARNRQAKELYSYATKNTLIGVSLTTKEGKAELKELETGIYLVAQVDKYFYQEKGYMISEPFLVSIPMQVNGEWKYQVNVEPKTEWQPATKPERKPVPHKQENNKNPNVKTGDSAVIVPFIISFFISIILIFIICRKNNK